MDRQQFIRQQLQGRYGGLPETQAYQEGLAQINRNLATTQAGLAGQTAQVKQGYGIEDVSDPFSRQALLRQHYEGARSQGMQQLAARGQLYSGAQANLANEQRLGYEQNESALQKEYQGQLQNLAQRGSQATQQAAGARSDLLRQLLTSTLNSPATALPVPNTRMNRSQLQRIARTMRLR